MSNCLPKSEILRRKKDFERVLFRGRRRKTGPVSLYYAPNPGAESRAGFIATGKFPTNVTRNLVKRRLREIYRTHRDVFPPGFDYILRGERDTAKMEFGALQNAVLELARGAIHESR